MRGLPVHFLEAEIISRLLPVLPLEIKLLLFQEKKVIK